MLGQQMASSAFVNVSASQVGTYFLGQYYQVLQKQPELSHQFYTNLSTVMHIDGVESHTVSGMMEIHSLISPLKITGIEIKTAHFLDSCNGGVLVVVSGLLKTEEFRGRRRFAQTFFLAPQEKGYFVLNDILHLQEEEYSHPTLLHHDNFETAATTADPADEPDASETTPEIEYEENKTEVLEHYEETENVDRYTVPEPQNIPEFQQEEEIPINKFVPPSANDSDIHEQSSLPADEPIREPPKLSYASILRVAKGQSGVPVQSQTPVAKPRPVSFPQPERSVATELEENLVIDDEGEVKSAYVRNLPSSATASELEHELRNFGKIKPGGVLIKSRKDADVYYAFVEFEDLAGVQNAVKASPIFFGGRQIYVEERRPGSLPARGRPGRGRGGRGSGYPGGSQEFGGGRERSNSFSGGQRFAR